MTLESFIYLLTQRILKLSLGGPLFVATAGYTTQNSSTDSRAVQLLYFDPNIKHAPDAQATAYGYSDASYMKVDISTFNQSRDMYTDGVLDMSKFKGFTVSGVERFMIDVLFIRRAYYDANDNLLGYDKGFNLNQWEVQTNQYYLALAQTAIQSTALFYPNVQGTASGGKWDNSGNSKHGLQYAIPDPGSHVMKFLPRNNDGDYAGFVNATYSHLAEKTIFNMGYASYNEDIFKRVVPVDPNYSYDYSTRDNTAGFVSKVNLGLD